jgi:hypothetical protein
MACMHGCVFVELNCVGPPARSPRAGRHAQGGQQDQRIAVGARQLHFRTHRSRRRSAGCVALVVHPLSLSPLPLLLALARADSKRSHVPYRDSKLTFILRDSLVRRLGRAREWTRQCLVVPDRESRCACLQGGNAKTSLLVTCSPHTFNGEETLSTLQFGQRAKAMRNDAKVNKQLSVSELAAMVRGFVHSPFWRRVREPSAGATAGKALGHSRRAHRRARVTAHARVRTSCACARHRSRTTAV